MSVPQMSEPSTVIPASLSASGYEDGLGRRSLEIDRESGAMLERLHLRAELGAFEAFLRERVAFTTSFDDNRFARVNAIERDRRGVLTIISQFVAGTRLSELLEAATGLPAGEATCPSVDAALGFLLEVLPALGSLHEHGGHAHGTLTPGRIVLTPTSDVVILDWLYGPAIQRLQFNRRRLWAEFGIGAAGVSGPVTLDVAADLSQLSLIAMMIVLGRPLREDEYPDAIATLVGEVIEIAQIRGSRQFGAGIEAFLQRTLPLPSRKPHANTAEAIAEVRHIAREIGVSRCRTALTAFVEDMNRVLAEERELEDRVTYDADLVDVDVDAAVDELTITTIADRETEHEEPGVADPVLDVAPSIDGPATPAFDEFEPSVGADVFEESEPVASSSPLDEYFSRIESTARNDHASTSVAPEPIERVFAPEPSREPHPTPSVETHLATIPPKPAAPEPPAPEPAPELVKAQAAATPPPAPPAPAPAPQPTAKAQSKRKKRGSKGQRDKLRSNAAPPAPKPAPAPAPAPPPAPVAIPMPTFSQFQDPSRPNVPAPPPVALQPPAPPQAAAPLRLRTDAPSNAPLRLKAEATSTFRPPPARVERRDVPEPVFSHFEREAEQGSGNFPWRLAAAGVVGIIVLIGVGRYFMLSHKDPVETVETAPAPQPSAPEKIDGNKAGTVSIATQPAGAHVFLDGKPVGDSPVTLQSVSPGKHTLTFVTSSGTVKKPIRVEPGKPLSLDVPIYSGWIAVFSPVTLDIAENGKPIGTTEQGRLMLSPGRHTLTFSSQAMDYKTTQVVDIEPGEERSISLVPTGDLSANAMPWAEVWMNGAKVGETPIAHLRVPLGTHEVVFKNPKFPDKQVTVTVTATGTAAAFVDFTK